MNSLRTLARRRNRRGAMLVLIAVMLSAFLVTVAFSVDVAYMQLTRTELRSAADAAAKAAAESLAREQTVAAALAAGKRAALQNQVAGEGLILRDSDFVFGASRQGADGRFAFTAGGTPTNSVRVTGARTTGSASGEANLFFGGMFGVDYFEPIQVATATYVERDVVLVVDRSGSMLGQKFLDLGAAIDVFVATLSETAVDEQVGLASYSSEATEDQALTGDLSQISAAFSRLSVGGRTSISAGMQAGMNILLAGRDSRFVERTLIVMTDGIHNTGVTPIETANAAAAEGIVIHTVTFGSDADELLMQEVATIGSGRSFHADSGLELSQVFREIAFTLETILTE